MAEDTTVIGILGGTGALGSGLGFRLARAKYRVLIGSRDIERARQAASELASGSDGPNLVGASNVDVAQQADLVIVAVPFIDRDKVLKEVHSYLKGKVVVDATVPLQPPKVSVVHLRPAGSGAEEMQLLLGSDVKVVSAFQNVAAAKLKTTNLIDCDVLVCGDDKDVKERVISLIERMGMAGLDAGVLANSVVAEALTSVLIGINRRYKTEAGIRITGIARTEK
ncbi:MAG: NADPH-dependent F420 reductase [Rhizobiales bacterium 62-47]|nr:NADPH-dependent F420 reductase [Hyphomicrobiales bacterium]OJY12294.1 MAG: NADPH-dependent F420 reductase [Rhizobiales bacterium 62-47]